MPVDAGEDLATSPASSTRWVGRGDRQVALEQAVAFVTAATPTQELTEADFRQATSATLRTADEFVSWLAEG